MSKKNKIFVSCEEANHICDKNQYKEASLLDKILLNIHLIYCRACRKYSSRNGKLSKYIKDSRVFNLEQDTKQRMQESLEKKIKEGSIG